MHPSGFSLSRPSRTGTFLGAGGRVARGPGGSDRVTVFPLPTRPLNDLTIQKWTESVTATYSGTMTQAVDLWRRVSSEDGWQSGLLRTMSEGILGLPLAFQGDAGMTSALLDVDGTPGDYGRMHPESECGQIFADGIATNMGLGQYVLMCWFCDGTNIDREGCCATCKRNQAARPIGQRKLYQLQWRDPRWLWRNVITLQWRYLGNGGQVDIAKGDGEWVLFQPYPDVDSWRHGPWMYMVIAGIFARDAVYDRQRTSETTSPTRVMRASKSTTKEARDELVQRLKDAVFDKDMVLSDEWVYEIVSAQFTYAEICDAIVAWATNMVEVGLTGNLMGMKAQSAFTDAGIYRRTTTERRRFYAKAWYRDIRSQGLVYWGQDNYGSRNVPVGSCDVESPEDKLAASKYLEQEMKSLDAYVATSARLGRPLDQRWIEDRLQRMGIRMGPAPVESAPRNAMLRTMGVAA